MGSETPGTMLLIQSKITSEILCLLLLVLCSLLIEQLNCLIYDYFHKAEECIFVSKVPLRHIRLNLHQQIQVYENVAHLFPPDLSFVKYEIYFSYGNYSFEYEKYFLFQ